MANENRGKTIQMKKVFNPTSEDLHFQYDSAEYVLKAGEVGTFVDYIAEHGAKKLADKNVKTNNEDEHKVLVMAYLENSDPEVIARRLGIDLDKIRKEAISKEQEKAKVTNLEAQMAEMREELKKMKEDGASKNPSKESKPKKEGKPKVKKENKKQ